MGLDMQICAAAKCFAVFHAPSRARLFLIVVAATAGLGSSSVRGTGPAPATIPTDALDAIVKDLASDDFQVRDAAQKKLDQVPAAQYGELVARAEAAVDPEVKARLLAAVRLRYELALTKMMDDHLPASPVLKVRFFNDTDSDLSLPLYSQTDNAEFFRFSITGPNGKALVGPIPARIGAPIPAQMSDSGATATGKSPFVVVKAGKSVESTLILCPQDSATIQRWCFPRAGQYTIIGEYVNSHTTYVDPQTHAVVAAQTPFVGKVQSAPLHVTVTHAAGDWVFGPHGGQALEKPPSAGALLIAGLTVDAHGKPLPGTVVEVMANKDTGRASSPDDPIMHVVVDRQRSGADGRFTFDALPRQADAYVLTAVHEGNYAQATATVTPAQALTKEDVKLTLKAGLTYRGKVVDRNGKALPGVLVTGAGKMDVAPGRGGRGSGGPAGGLGTVYTEADGRFLIEGLDAPGCDISCVGFTAVSAAKPEAGHEQDGTWTVALTPETPVAPLTGMDLIKQITANRIQALRGETPEQSVRDLMKVGDFYNSGISDGGGEFLDNRLFPFAPQVGALDVQRVYGNRRFLKVFDELSGMPKPQAAKLLATEMEKSLALYTKMFDEEWEFLVDVHRGDDPNQSSGGAGPSLQISDSPDGKPTLAGLRLQLLSLALVAGNLELPDAKQAVSGLVRAAVEQQRRVSGDVRATLVNRYFMLESAGIYNRQILSAAIAGTAAKEVREELNAAPGALVVTSLTHYDAAQTAVGADNPAMLGGKPDFTKGTLKVRVHSSIDDAAFLETVKKAGIAVKTDPFDAPDKR